MGLDIGIFAIPVYQDFSFNLDLPTQNPGKFSIFGLGGLNSLTDKNYNAETDIADTTDVGSYVGFSGINHLYYFNESSSLSTSLGGSSTQNKTLMLKSIEGVIEDFSWVKNTESTLDSTTNTPI